jgi:hypothetical protein
MDHPPYLPTNSDLEIRAARIADPGIGWYYISTDYTPGGAHSYILLRSQDETHCSM